MPKYYDLEPYERIYTFTQKYDNEYARGWCKAIQRILEDKPLDLAEVMHGAWIPVIERLPDEDGECLVTLESTFAKDYGLGLIGIATYDAEAEAFGEWRFGEFYDAPVTAWMPLPKPYEENGDD